MNQRFNLLKTKKANGILKDEFTDLQRQFAERGRLIATLKKTEDTAKAKYNMMLEQATQKQNQLVDAMKNERLGLLNQAHSLKQLTAEMRTENKDLRAQIVTLTKLYRDQSEQMTKERSKAEAAANDKIESAKYS